MDIEALEKLNELKEKGAITPEEFEAKKAEILNGNNEAENSSLIISKGKQFICDFVNPNTHKKQIMYLWLSFLGIFGIHNFYLGQTDRGLIKLVVGILTIVFSCLDFDYSRRYLYLILIIAVILVQMWTIIEIYGTFKTSTKKDLKRVSDKIKDSFCGVQCGIIGLECGILATIYFAASYMARLFGRF